MRNILIRLSIDSYVHQTTDILVADIPEAYGLLLSRDWSSQLNDYFTTDWSHLWLPYNEKPNQIQVKRERYVKHTVTELKAPNEPIMFINTILGNYYFDTFPLTGNGSIITPWFHNLKVLGPGFWFI